MDSGDVIFIMMEGQGLASETAGGNHGNSDDPDLDIKMISRVPGMKDMYAHCMPWNHLGSFGYYPYPADTPDLYPMTTKVLDLDPRKPISGLFHSACICEWEGIEVLCPGSPKYNSYRFGGSWWVPPVKGFKDTGAWIKFYADKSFKLNLYAQIGWARDTVAGLTTLDANNDGQLVLREVWKYIRGSKRINQLWVDDMLQNDPCVVWNAKVHYNHTYVFLDKVIKHRNRPLVDDKTFLARVSEWSEPRYRHNSSECAQFMQSGGVDMESFGTDKVSWRNPRPYRGTGYSPTIGKEATV
jgi:hypothetical protein